MNSMCSARKILPMNTDVRVQDLTTGRSVDVRINDRGPFGRARGIELSREAAKRLGIMEKGTARVRVTALSDVPQYRNVYMT
ncbi:septal ring lytic transglycosylase RlpA family lipoprotein, partial [Oceanidesulfovibrio indonesiensis]